MRVPKKYLCCSVDRYNMPLDPTNFASVAVTDTCSAWNLLSSRKLYQASISAKRHFCITPMVLYECLFKPRTSMTPEKEELIGRLEKTRREGGFRLQECDLEDLALLARQVPKGLGSGEMSCMAAAYRIRSISFMTDEKKARRFAAQQLGLNVETTPKLYAWLHYHRHLGDVDHGDVIREHERYEARPLTAFFNDAFNEATRWRLMDR